MDNVRSAAERVRPILRAMERSIDSARRKRLQETKDEETGTETVAPEPSENGEPAVRLKARPKRPSSLLGSRRADYHSEAG